VAGQSAETDPSTARAGLTSMNIAMMVMRAHGTKARRAERLMLETLSS
jgi:hypothetical protein